MIKIILFLICLKQFVDCQVEVETRLGKIIGFNDRFENYTLDVFYGIPYGKAPIKELRFKKTDLIDKFDTNPFYATQFTSHCPIRDETVLKGAPIKEDCLHLNIWRPSKFNLFSQQLIDHESLKKKSKESTTNSLIDGLINLSLNRPHVAKEVKLDFLNEQINQITNETVKTKKKEDKNELNKCTKKYPVLIYFYGGVGSIFMLDHYKQQTIAYDGAILAALGDLILVTVNYRMGPFGNLYIPGKVQGNAGFFDQALSIEWVNKNIDSFCGDHRRITIFGNSLGSISVGFNLLSSYANPFFQQAIMQSASPLYNQLTPDTAEEAYEKSLEFAENANCLKVKNEKKSIDLKCLQDVPLEEVQKYMIGFYHFPSFAGDFFNRKSKLLYKFQDILNIPKNKKVLIGLVNNEICLGAPEYLLGEPLDPNTTPYVSKKQAQKSLLIRLAAIGTTNTKETLKIINFYTSKERKYNTSDNYYESLNAFASDFAFNCPVTFFAKSCAERLPYNVFTYVISKQPKTHYLNVIPNFNWTRVCHADELSYLFGQSFKNLEYFDDSDRLFSRELISIFADFVHNGKPSELTDPIKRRTNSKEWPAATSFNLNYVNLDLNEIKLKHFDLEDRCLNLWWPFHKKLLRQGISIDGEAVPYTKLPPKSDLLVFTIFFVSAIVILIILVVIERYLARKRKNYEKF